MLRSARTVYSNVIRASLAVASNAGFCNESHPDSLVPARDRWNPVNPATSRTDPAC